MHFSRSGWSTQSRLSANIPLFDFTWKMITLSVAKLEMFSSGKQNFSRNKVIKKKVFVKSLDPSRRLELREKVQNVLR